MIFTFVFAILILAFFTIGLGLENRREVEASLAIEAPHETVYGLLIDLKTGWSKWNPLMRQISGLEIEYGPQTSGQGATVRWIGRASTGSVELTTCTPHLGISYRTTASLGRMSAVGTIELRRQRSATVVTWRDEISVGSNPVWKWLARAMDGGRQQNLARGLATLKRVAEPGEPLGTDLTAADNRPFPSSIIALFLAVAASVTFVVRGYLEWHAGRGCDGGTCTVAFLFGLVKGAAALTLGFPSLWLLIAGARRVARRLRH